MSMTQEISVTTVASPTLKSALAALSRRDLPSASRLFTSMLASANSAANGHYGLGLVSLQRGDLDVAEKHMLTAMAAGARADNTNYYLGVINERRGQHDLAIAFYRKALSTNPKHAGAAKRLPTLAGQDGADAGDEDGTPTPTGSQASQPQPPKPPSPHLRSRLSEDRSNASQAAEQLVQKLEGTVHPKALLAIDGGFVAALRAVVKSFAVAWFVGILSFAASATPLFNVFSPRTLLWALLGLATAFFVLVPLTRFGVLMLDVSRRSYCFRDGRLVVTVGAFRRQSISIELFRVTEVAVTSGVFGQLMGGATLTLTAMDMRTGPALQVSLLGLERTQAETLASLIREASINMRSLPWIKGVVE